MNSVKYVLPNKGNAWVFVFLFLTPAVVLLIVGLMQGRFFSSGAWYGVVASLLALALALGYIQAQRVMLGEHAIRHRSLGIFKLNIKEFNYNELEYWKIDRLTLVIVAKGGKAPELPHGPKEDLSRVMLIPASLFSPRTKEITDHLTHMGVNENKAK